MKKFLFFPNTIFRPFIISIPFVFLLVVSIIMNPVVDTLVKLYPLIIFSACAVIFTFTFFFRPVILSREEIKSIGPFSSRDKAIINEGKTLIITPRRSGLVSIDLYGNYGINAGLDWLKNETVTHDTYLFKSKVLGGVATMKHVLLFFGVEPDIADTIIASDNIEKEVYGLIISLSTNQENVKEMRIEFTKTL